MDSIYHAPAWKAYREKVLAADDYKCTRCSQTLAQRTLQVHHKYYIRGRLPWEYPMSACLVLCRSCHAQHHGKNQPMKGWQYMGYAYAPKVRGRCENCNTSIKHLYFIFHPQWGMLQVGTVCCDHLTATSYATNERKKESQRKKYLVSPQWRTTPKGQTRRYKGHHILAFRNADGYSLKIDATFGKKHFATLQAAQNHAFDVLHGGIWQEYLKKHPHLT